MTPDNEPIPEDYYLKYDGPDEFVKGEKHIPQTETDIKAVMQSLRDKVREANKENTRLRKLIENIKQILERANDKGMFYYDSVIKEIEKL